MRAACKRCFELNVQVFGACTNKSLSTHFHSELTTLNHHWHWPNQFLAVEFLSAIVSSAVTVFPTERIENWEFTSHGGGRRGVWQRSAFSACYYYIISKYTVMFTMIYWGGPFAPYNIHSWASPTTLIKFRCVLFFVFFNSHEKWKNKIMHCIFIYREAWWCSG